MSEKTQSLTDAIKQEISADSVIDSTKLDLESLKITKLQSKWIIKHAELLRLQRQMENKKAKVVKSLTLYYLGKASDETYKNKPLNHKILKSDLSTWLEADDLYIEIHEASHDIAIALSATEMFLKDLSQRSFNIRNAIEYRKFQAGV